MITWGKEKEVRRERRAEIAATVFMVAAAAYILGHILAAWLRGGFQVVTR